MRPGGGGHVDDVAAVLEQVRQRGLAHEERAGEVDVDDALPFVERLLVRVGELADAGDVADDVGRTEVGDDRVDRRRHRRLVGHVARVGLGLAARVGDAGGGLVACVRGDVEAGDRRTFGGEAARRGPPDAGARAGDDGGLAAEAMVARHT